MNDSGLLNFIKSLKTSMNETDLFVEINNLKVMMEEASKEK